MISHRSLRQRTTTTALAALPRCRSALPRAASALSVVVEGELAVLHLVLQVLVPPRVSN
jgi:hypothetical protein